MWSPDYYDSPYGRTESDIEIDEGDENSVDYDNYYDVETDIDIQPVTNFWEFILLVLMYPSFFTRNLN